MKDFELEERPRAPLGSNVVSPKSANLMKLFGSEYRYQAVSFTRDELDSLKKMYGFTKDESTSKMADLIQAGSNRNLMRHAEADGLRLVAWLARYTEPGQDPVKVLVQLAIEAGMDVDPSDVDWIDYNYDDEEVE